VSSTKIKNFQKTHPLYDNLKNVSFYTKKKLLIVRHLCHTLPMDEIQTSLVSDLSFDVIAEQITGHMSEEFTWHCEFMYKGKCYEGIIEACAVDPKEIHADKITNIEEKK
jgi:hypothetical protein